MKANGKMERDMVGENRSWAKDVYMRDSMSTIRKKVMLKLFNIAALINRSLKAQAASNLINRVKMLKLSLRITNLDRNFMMLNIKEMWSIIWLWKEMVWLLSPFLLTKELFRTTLLRVKVRWLLSMALWLRDYLTACCVSKGKQLSVSILNKAQFLKAMSQILIWDFCMKLIV